MFRAPTLGPLLLAFLAASLCAGASAQVPTGITYQGYLANADGTPVDGDVQITFSAFNVDFSGVPLWSQTSTLPVAQGLFSVALADVANPFPADLFDGPVYIGVFIDGEELLPRRALTSSAYAFKAADADALQGETAADLDQSADIVRLEGDIAATGSSIQDLTTAVGQNADRISDLELNGGDITAVIAGPGLGGGSASGDAVLQVAAGGIVNSMIGPGAVSESKLAAGSITSVAILDRAIQGEDVDLNTLGPEHLRIDQNYSFFGLTIDGGPLRMENVPPIVIEGSDNEILWLSNTGTPLGGLAVSASAFRLQRGRLLRDFLVSDSDGLKLAGAASAPGFAVTAPSLKVEGALEVDGPVDIGIETVVQSFSLATLVPCTLNSSNFCFRGTGTAVCPVGKRVIGGGWGIGQSPSILGYVTASGPSATEDAWICEGVITQSAVRTCRAFCVSEPS